MNGWSSAQTVTVFTPDRVMFASNVPVDSLCGAIDQLFTGFKTVLAAYPLAQHCTMFHDNAARIYRIVLPKQLRHHAS